MAGARAEGVVKTDAGGEQRNIYTRAGRRSRTKDGKALGNAKGSSSLESVRVRGSEDQSIERLTRTQTRVLRSRSEERGGTREDEERGVRETKDRC